ncbi:MAG TPA: class II fumarate hydratase [Candidatus Margulisiibacteriota bacterium]|nr:class II fumarate hydratase [Candidatus Margulisiibacteriota bacterium]
MSDFRIEKDSMGEMRVPANAYYGAQTARAVDNFPISTLRFSRRFIQALGHIKAAAARANVQLKLLEPKLGQAIEAAAVEVANGKFDGEFVVDVFQTGSGTSTNMNANEVICTRAIELLGGTRGDKSLVHPNDHVNMGQSTNDVFPTAIHVAAMGTVETHVLPAMRQLAEAFHAKANEFADVVKAGRTHLQDAVPVTLGQEFSGYASVIRHGVARIEATRSHLSELAIGGTALGTGLNAHPEFAARVITELRTLTGHLFRRAENAFEAMQNRDACVELSGALKTVAVGLMKIANDLRLLTSGPRTGLNEIELPATQPGSSIMPGKVNPVIAEAVNMVAAHLIGNDAAIAVAGMNGNLDLNVMMPVIAHNLLESLDLLGSVAKVFAEKCVGGITANVAQCLDYAERTASLVTAVAPILGYDVAAKIFKKALAENQPMRQAILEEGLIPKAQLDEILHLKKLTEGGRA